MDNIFHEKQEGYLCAQHCLNALLQGPYFTPVDLATLAQQADEQERERMAESGVDSDEYRQFIEQPSGNMDDSGYFSVQVIVSALNVWNLELVPYNSSEPRAFDAQKAPQSMQAYICNYRDHWFTIRRLGRQWFNLNSMLTGPQLISDTYLSVYLAQLQHEGYSIFVVFGSLPDCQAHELLLINPAVQSSQPKAVEMVKNSQGHRLGNASEDPNLQIAISRSILQTSDFSPKACEIIQINDGGDDEDDDLQRVLQESIGEVSSKEAKLIDGHQIDDLHDDVAESAVDQESVSPFITVSEDDDLQKALRLSLQQQDTENDLKKALQMSLECVGTEHHPSSTSRSTNIDLAEIRARRIRYLEGAGSQTASKSSST